jgi:hypothetical protein
VLLSYNYDDLESNFRSENESVSEVEELSYNGGQQQQQALQNYTHDELQQQNHVAMFKKKIRIVLHVVLACYCFWMLAIICDEYFIASIHVFCQSL